MFAFTHSAIRAYDTNSDVCWGNKKLFSSFSAILFAETFQKYTCCSWLSGRGVATYPIGRSSVLDYG